MNRSTQPLDEHLLDLLALRAVEGLNDADEAAVASLDDADFFDGAAAVLAMRFSVLDGLEPLPVSLRRGLAQLGTELIAGRDTRLTNRSGEPANQPVSANSARPASEDGAAVEVDRRWEIKTGSGSRASAGWVGALGWLAAAACLALAVIGWSLPRNATTAETPEARLASLQTRPGIVRTAWVGLDTAGLSDAAHRLDRNLSGEVVWDPETNEGCMVFDGLVNNDPDRFQYQLWIFDETRPTGQLPHFGEGILSQRPVDGGVFDIGAEGRVVVPIRAKLPVGKAVIFAITVEPPGGVVVSDRDIVTLALVKD